MAMYCKSSFIRKHFVFLIFAKMILSQILNAVNISETYILNINPRIKRFCHKYKTQ